MLENLQWEKMQDLMPVIVQHEKTRRVLMLAYMNPDALATTLATKIVTFYSRSKQRLWTKGETSGHILKLVSITADCDNDALLVIADPAGPTCHTGDTSCFANSDSDIDFLNELSHRILSRQKNHSSNSYVAQLFRQGTKRIAQKVGEEGVEVALAAVAGDREELCSELADLLFHSLVLMTDQAITLNAVIAVLRARQKITY